MNINKGLSCLSVAAICVAAIIVTKDIIATLVASGIGLIIICGICDND